MHSTRIRLTRPRPPQAGGSRCSLRWVGGEGGAVRSPLPPLRTLLPPWGLTLTFRWRTVITRRLRTFGGRTVSSHSRRLLFLQGLQTFPEFQTVSGTQDQLPYSFQDFPYSLPGFPALFQDPPGCLGFPRAHPDFPAGCPDSPPVHQDLRGCPHTLHAVFPRTPATPEKRPGNSGQSPPDQTRPDFFLEAPLVRRGAATSRRTLLRCARPILRRTPGGLC
mmetsp:Transcript_41788/g.103097  ORF Transcript_41788/g.103097 Transcript_41788/m.103097 type:complete len:220 (+) Transcript_41788:925-1584(+)